MKIRIVIAVMLGFSCVSVADTLVVRPDGTGDYPTIQLAILAAQIGDVIELADGVFSGLGNHDIQFYGKRIELRSQSGDPESCVIDIRGLSNNGISERGLRFIQYERNATVVRDISIIHAGADGECPNCQGGALEIRNSSPTLINMILRANYANEGAGVFIEGENARPVFERCIFTDNLAQTGSGGSLNFGAGAIFKDCVFVGNSVIENGWSPAIRAYYDCDLLLDGCTIAYNTAPYASASEFYGSRIMIRNSIITGNRGDQALRIFSNSTVWVRYSAIAGNDSTDWPEGISRQSTRFGNLVTDPLLAANPEMIRSLQLSPASPCIDAGDPDARPDPDGTRRDMGAFYFDQSTAAAAANAVTESGSEKYFTQRLSDAATLHDFSLSPLFPNPFNARAALWLSLPERDAVRLVLYDVLGCEVKTLHRGTLAPGVYEFSVSADDLASGNYFVVARSDRFGSQVRKVVLAR